MRRKLQLLPEAELDVAEAVAFYAEQERGLGDEVLEFIDSQFEELASFPGTHRRYGRFFCKTVRGRFPYFLIYYKLTVDAVVIYAVVDGRRDPVTNTEKLRRRP